MNVSVFFCKVSVHKKIAETDVLSPSSSSSSVLLSSNTQEDIFGKVGLAKRFSCPRVDVDDDLDLVVVVFVGLIFVAVPLRTFSNAIEELSLR